MTLKKVLTILLSLSVLCLVFSAASQADCTKFCRIIPKVHITFMMIPKSGTIETDQRRGFTHLTELKAEGYYGGGCNTAIGREKARKRACSAAKKLAKKAYEGKPDNLKREICKTEAHKKGNYALILFKGGRGKISVIPHDEVKWIQINRVEFAVLAQDGTSLSVRKKGEFTLKGDGKKFACKNGKRVPVK